MQMWRAHLSNTKLLRLFAIGFLLTSVLSPCLTMRPSA